MADLKERVDQIIDHHSSEGAKAGAVMQEWTARMAYDVGQEVLREEKYKHFRGLESSQGGKRLLDFSPIRRKAPEDRKEISVTSLSKELNISMNTLPNYISMAVAVDKEFGSFEAWLQENAEIWYRVWLGKIKPQKYQPKDEPVSPAAGKSFILKTAEIVREAENRISRLLKNGNIKKHRQEMTELYEACNGLGRTLVTFSKGVQNEITTKGRGINKGSRSIDYGESITE